MSRSEKSNGTSLTPFNAAKYSLPVVPSFVSARKA